MGPGAAYVAVVDVLSFTTTLTVAGERTDSAAVPVLSGGWFTDGGRTGPQVDPV